MGWLWRALGPVAGFQGDELVQAFFLVDTVGALIIRIGFLFRGPLWVPIRDL